MQIKKVAPIVPLEKQQGLTEISVPFSTKEFRSDQEAFRSKQSGRSPDQSTAKKIAYQNARAEMAANINATVKELLTNILTKELLVINKNLKINLKNYHEKLSTYKWEMLKKLAKNFFKIS